MEQPAVLPDSSQCWPPLLLADWKDTYATLHMWTQIVGKIRLELTPLLNHWWNVPLYVSPCGLTTSIIAYGNRSFEMEFDFFESKLVIRTSDQQTASVALAPRSVADFYREMMDKLHSLGIEVKIWKMPVEVPDPIPFDRDTVHAAYDAESAQRLWRILQSIDAVFKVFRARFVGKSSPVHFFWGSFDLAVTRFSGRAAPPPPSNPVIPDPVNREAYSRECSSAGFWPGNGGFGQPAFYSYAYPQPPGFAGAAITTEGAYYSKEIGEFILPYEAVRQAPSPGERLLDFLRQTYSAAADLGKWDRATLERRPPSEAPLASPRHNQ